MIGKKSSKNSMIPGVGLFGGVGVMIRLFFVN